MEVIESEQMFYDIIPYLQKGISARMKDWKDGMHIALDPVTKSLVLHSMDVLPFMPDFASFVAEDWVVVP